MRIFSLAVRSKFRTGAGVLLCAVALIPVGASAELVDIEWKANGSASHEFNVEPGKFAEWCAKLQRNQRIHWSFVTTSPLDFNIHYHEGKDVHYPAKHTAVSTTRDTLTVPIDQDYCWTWSNKSKQPATIRATLDKEG